MALLRSQQQPLSPSLSLWNSHSHKYTDQVLPTQPRLFANLSALHQPLCRQVSCLLLTETHTLSTFPSSCPKISPSSWALASYITSDQLSGLFLLFSESVSLYSFPDLNESFSKISPGLRGCLCWSLCISVFALLSFSLTL